METREGGIGFWIKSHISWVLGGLVSAVVLLYLVRRPSGGRSAPTSVSFPAQGGGPPGNLSPSAGPPPAAPNITLPFNPDFGILASITDDVKRRLYESEYQIELQINAATTAGNTDLINSLTTRLNDIQAQLAAYKPAVPDTPATPNTAPTLGGDFAARLINAALGAQARLGPSYDPAVLWRQFFGSMGIGQAVTDYVRQKSDDWTHASGQRSTTDQLQQWLNDAYKQGLDKASGSTTTLTSGVMSGNIPIGKRNPYFSPLNPLFPNQGG